MKNLAIKLTEEERALVKRFSKEHGNNWQIVKRLEALRLLDSGLTVSTISEQLCVNLEVVYKYIKTYKEKGIEGLVTLEKPGREAKLTVEQIEKIEHYIEDCRRNKIKCTTKEQVAWVKREFGVDIGPKWLYKRLLIRRHNKLDRINSFLLWSAFIGNQLTTLPGIKRTLFLLFHSAQYVALYKI